LANGRKIQAAMVLVSTGAKPASDIARNAGLRIVENGSIWVDEYMRTDAGDLFAVGDCAAKRDFFTPKGFPDIIEKIWWWRRESSFKYIYLI
jgi:NADH oxidase (H2O2-forming)